MILIRNIPIPIYAIVLGVFIVAITVSSVSASHVFHHVEGDTQIDGTLDVGGPIFTDSGNIVTTDGNLIGQKQGNQHTIFAIKNDQKDAIFRFQQTDDNNQKYDIRLSQNADRLAFVNVNNGTTDLVVELATGDVGVGVNNPTERLDVNGNVRIRGDIVSTNDITISSNGDICIGKCP